MRSKARWSLQKGTLRDEREVLRGHGNMSAPSVLFVLDRALKRGLRGPAVLAALGPGFTASFLALEAAWLTWVTGVIGQGAWLVAFLVVQRLAELALAQWNTARLRARRRRSNSAPRIIRSWSRCTLSGCWHCGWPAMRTPSIRSGWRSSLCCRSAGCG